MKQLNGISFVAGRWPLDETLPTIIFIHGSGGTNAMWHDQVDGLATDMNTIAIDLPGHGKSEGTGSDQIEVYADNLSKFATSLNVGKPVICGLSIGGAISLQLLLDKSDAFKAGVIVNSGARLKVWPLIFEAIDENYEGYINMLSAVSLSEKSDPNILKPVTEGMAACSPDVTKGDFKACDSFDVMERLHEIKHPVLVLSASDDKLTPVKYGTFLADKLENAEILNIEDAGHMSPVEKPDEVSQAIKNFIMSL